MIKRPNLRTHRVEKGTDIQIKGIRNLFNEIIAEIVPNLCNRRHFLYHVQETFQTPNNIIRKEQIHNTHN
jgi:hypothetical protein